MSGSKANCLVLIRGSILRLFSKESSNLATRILTTSHHLFLNYYSICEHITKIFRSHCIIQGPNSQLRPILFLNRNTLVLSNGKIWLTNKSNSLISGNRLTKLSLL